MCAHVRRLSSGPVIMRLKYYGLGQSLVDARLGELCGDLAIEKSKEDGEPRF